MDEVDAKVFASLLVVGLILICGGIGWIWGAAYACIAAGGVLLAAAHWIIQQ